MRAGVKGKRLLISASIRTGAVCVATAVFGVSNLGFSDAVEAQEVVDLPGIVVTARREKEPLLEVPESVTVDQDPSEAIQIPSDGAAQVGRRVMNYAVTDVGNPNQTFAAIRGVGALGYPLNAFDTSVTYAVNGLPVSLYAGYQQLLDLDRIEVLRGPQNVLYGRSSQGGTINYVTREADGARDLRIRGEIGTDGEYLTDIVLGDTIVEGVLNGRVALRLTGGDGYITNISNGDTLPKREIGAARGSLRAFLSDRTTLDLMGYFERDNRETYNAFLLRGGPGFPSSSVLPTPEFDRDLFVGNAVLRHEFDSFDLTGSFGYQAMDYDAHSDQTDGLLWSPLLGGAGFGFPPSFFDTPGTDDYIGRQRERAVFGEVRASSVAGDGNRWIVGAGVYQSDFDHVITQTSQFNPPANGTNDINLKQTEISVFGEVGLRVTDRLTFTPGIRIGEIRFDRDDTFTSNGSADILPTFSDSGTFEDTFVAGGVSLDYEVSRQARVYGSVKQGYAGGGFVDYNADAPFGISLSPYPSSTSWTYEAGARALLIDDRLYLNASAFLNEVKDGHVQAYDIVNLIFTVEPLDYRTYGFEAEARLKANDDWELAGAVGLTESEFVNVDPNTQSGAVAGNPLPNIPRWQAAFSATNTLPLSDHGLTGRLVSTAEVQFVDERQADIANSFSLDSYTLLNARIGWERDNFKIYAFGYNLTDEVIETLGARFGVSPVTGEPIDAVALATTRRVIGIGAEIAF